MNSWYHVTFNVLIQLLSLLLTFYQCGITVIHDNYMAIGT